MFTTSFLFIFMFSVKQQQEMLFDTYISDDYDVNSYTNLEIRSGNRKSAWQSLFTTAFTTSISEYFSTHTDGNNQVLLFYIISNGGYAMNPFAFFVKS